jgi:hypothetical protein
VTASSRPAPRAARAARGAVAIAVLAVLGVGGACGYSSKRLVEVSGVSTVAVMQFDNETFRRDLEFRLTQAVAEEVRARTSWRIASERTADVLLAGTVRSAETRVLAEDPDTSDPVLDRLTVVVDARLVDRRTGRVLREWRAVASDEFARDRFGESLEGSAIDVATRRLAQDVVRGLERPLAPQAPATAVPPRTR